MAAATDSLANVPHNISISYLPHADNLSQRALDKGLSIFTQGYIHDVKIFNQEYLRISAKCYPSMRKNDSPHRINIQISSERETIEDANCSCKAGSGGHCAHVVGLIKTLQGLKLHNFTHIPDRQSCTSIPQQWNVPRGTKISPVPINHVTVARPTEKRKRKPISCQVDTSQKLPKVDPDDLQYLQGLGGTPLVYRISHEVPTISTVFGQVQIGSALSYQSKNIKPTTSACTVQLCGDLSVHRSSPIALPEMYKNLNKATHCQDPVAMELQTREQANSDTWFKERSTRLTASNFGRVVNRKAQPNVKFLNSIFKRVNITAKSLDYGKLHEDAAKDKYLEQYPSRHFHKCGFVENNEFSFLGATPDGKLCDNGQCGIVEIKCPYSARNMKLSQACDEIDDFFLQKDGLGNISIKLNHHYYAQIQGQLMVTRSEFCEFIVFTQQDLFVQQIQPDKNFMEIMLQKLCVFYTGHVLEYLSLIQ